MGMNLIQEVKMSKVKVKSVNVINQPIKVAHQADAYLSFL